MFGRKNRSPHYTAPTFGQPETTQPVTEYVVPGWVTDYPGWLEGDEIADHLLSLHERLMASATTTSTGTSSPWLEAAEVIQSLHRAVTTTYVYRDGLDVVPEVNEAITEVLRVLREWDTTTPPTQAYHRFEVARGWATHVNMHVTAASARRIAGVSNPLSLPPLSV
jgi:hypothetical protein